MPLQMHTIVEAPLTRDGRGRILCHPIGQGPIQFTWHSPDGREVALFSGGSEARDLPPGRYRSQAEDATMARAEVVVDVFPARTDAVVIGEYRVTHASNTLSRDGRIQVLGERLEGVEFLWTSGARTDVPELHDVAPGTYAAVPVGKDGVPVSFFHAPGPAVVDVDSTGRWGHR